MSKTIPLSEPALNGREWRYVKDCLDTGWVSSNGKYIDRFEGDIARYTKCKYAVALSSGTAALQVALKLVNVQPGDEVIVPTVTFIAPVNAVTYHQATPIFMDCDDFYNMDVEKTVEFILEQTQFIGGYSINRRTKKKVKAIIPVHVFGNAVNLSRLIKVCRQRNIKIVEDATESLGTFYKNGRHTGTWGDIGCLSFNGNKIITTGGGGMILTNHASYAKQARYLTTQAKDDPVHYVHNDIGFNFRMTNIQAAMGVAQLKELPKIIKVKQENYRAYKGKIDRIPGLTLAGVPDYADSNYWMYALQIDRGKYGIGRDELLKTFLKNNIQVRPVWYLNHLQKPYEKCQTYKIKKAQHMLKRTLNIPCSVGLSRAQIIKTVGILRNGNAQREN